VLGVGNDGFEELVELDELIYRLSASDELLLRCFVDIF
jgi:hypothetical protein